MKQLSLLAAALLLTLASCRPDDQPIITTPGKDRLVVGLATPASNTQYIASARDLNTGSVDASRSYETKLYSWFATRGDYAFVSESRFGNRLLRYRRRDGGGLDEAGALTLPSGANNANVFFRSDDEAYAACWGLDKVVKFNPQTLTQTGVLEIPAAVSRASAPDSSLNPTAMAVRGDLLFVACGQFDAFELNHDSATVAIFDLTSGALVKVIKDGRAAGAGGHPGANDGITLDENGDLYVYCAGSYGFIGPAQNHGWLRIRAGETSFDPGYFFNLTSATVAALPGGKTDYLYQFEYAGAGVFYATANVPALYSNPPDYINDFTFQPMRFDVRAQTAAALTGLKPGTIAGCSVTMLDGKAVFALNTKSAGIGLFTYDPATGSASSAPVVTTSAAPILVRAFK